MRSGVLDIDNQGHRSRGAERLFRQLMIDRRAMQVPGMPKSRYRRSVTGPEPSRLARCPLGFDKPRAYGGSQLLMVEGTLQSAVVLNGQESDGGRDDRTT